MQTTQEKQGEVTKNALDLRDTSKLQDEQDFIKKNHINDLVNTTQHGSNANAPILQNTHDISTETTDNQAVRNEDSMNLGHNKGNRTKKNVSIKIEQRTFSLNLENLDSSCQNKILSIFEQKSYSLEELLSMFIAKVRDESLAEMELKNILTTLQNQENTTH